MIFSTTPSTCVVAGAGSGKSTTLVLRILLLHHYLGFELSPLAVVTFTNMSRRDFVTKLIETCALWDIDLPVKEAKAVVCTFHSKILTFVRGLPGYAKVSPFEFVKKRDGVGDDEDEDRLPFETRLNGLQQELLNTRLEPDPFADGALSGLLCRLDKLKGRIVAVPLLHFRTRRKRADSAVGATLGATGRLYGQPIFIQLGRRPGSAASRGRRGGAACQAGGALIEWGSCAPS